MNNIQLQKYKSRIKKDGKVPYFKSHEKFSSFLGTFFSYLSSNNGGSMGIKQIFLPGDLWLGLRKIQQLTTEVDYSLHVTLKDFDNKTYRAVYSHFEVIINND